MEDKSDNSKACSESSLGKEIKDEKKKLLTYANLSDKHEKFEKELTTLVTTTPLSTPTISKENTVSPTSTSTTALPGLVTNQLYNYYLK